MHKAIKALSILTTLALSTHIHTQDKEILYFRWCINQKPEITADARFKEQRKAYLGSIQRFLIHADRLYTCDNVLPQIHELSSLNNFISLTRKDYARGMQYKRELETLKPHVSDHGSIVIHLLTQQSLSSRTHALKKLLNVLQKKYKTYVPHTDCT